MYQSRLFRSSEGRISFIYFSVAAVWILVSDAVLHFLGINETLIPRLSILKGLAFVLVTSVILHRRLSFEFNLQRRMDNRLREQVRRAEQANAKLQQSEKRFRKAIEEAPHPIIMFTEDGEILGLSRTWLEITGYTREQLDTVDHWIELAYNPSEQPAIKAGINQLFGLPNRVDEGEFTIRCADNSRRIWFFSTTPLGPLPDGRRMNITIASDITEQKQNELAAIENERLKASIQKERERNLFVQQIIASLSHDLRTPLTVISTAKDILQSYSDRISAEKREEKLESIGRQVQFALELLENTVQMVRGNLSKNNFNPSPVHIAALCQVSAEEIEAAYNHTHPIQFTNYSQAHIVIIDEVLVSRILLNLLSNAVKYTEQGQLIRLELDEQDHRLILRVIDHGIGIKAQDHREIFEPFFRADEAQTTPGSGLGLSIVKDCVDRHQGEISVESTPGKGSTFTVKIPYETLSEAEAIQR
jgi:PAS domain S-box-containing protein